MKRAQRKLIKYSICILFVVVIIYVCYTYVLERVIVVGNSMEPTLINEEQILLDKVSYLFLEPSRYDVVVIENKLDLSSLYIKRMIGIPGDEIFYNEDGYATVNGIQVSGEFRFEKSELSAWQSILEPIVLGEDEYFVLGDNRNESIDSRSSLFGLVKKDEIIGKAWIKIWPISEIK